MIEKSDQELGIPGLRLGSLLISFSGTSSAACIEELRLAMYCAFASPFHIASPFSDHKKDMVNIIQNLRNAK
jgi:hypothetical protein